LVNVLDQNGPVSRATSLDIFNTLSSLLHGSSRDPGLDVLVSSELQHPRDLGLGANVRGSDKGAVASHSLRSQCRPVGFGHTVPDELALRDETGNEFVERKAGIGSGADDDVEAQGVFLGEIPGGGNKVLGSHLQRIILLSLRVGEDLCQVTDGHMRTGIQYNFLVRPLTVTSAPNATANKTA
jgi:hypothetical protein